MKQRLALPWPARQVTGLATALDLRDMPPDCLPALDLTGVLHTGGSGRLLNHSNRASNGIQVDQGVARKAKQKPEGEMEGTKTAAASEAP